MRPNMSVARFSFFLAIRRFSFSGSRTFTFGSAGSISQLGVVVTETAFVFALWFLCFLLPLLWWWLWWCWSLLVAFDMRLPNIGWHSRNFNGLTTEHRLTTPESELDGSNSLTPSFSTFTESARPRPPPGSFLQCVEPGLVTSIIVAAPVVVPLVDDSVNVDSLDLPSCAAPSTRSVSRYMSLSFSAPASLVETSEAKSQVTIGIDIFAADVPGTCCSVVPFFGGFSMVAISCSCCGIESWSLQALGPGGIGIVLGFENFVSCTRNGEEKERWWDKVNTRVGLVRKKFQWNDVDNGLNCFVYYQKDNDDDDDEWIPVESSGWKTALLSSPLKPSHT